MSRIPRCIACCFHDAVGVMAVPRRSQPSTLRPQVMGCFTPGAMWRALIRAQQLSIVASTTHISASEQTDLVVPGWMDTERTPRVKSRVALLAPTFRFKREGLSWQTRCVFATCAATTCFHSTWADTEPCGQEDAQLCGKGWLRQLTEIWCIPLLLYAWWCRRESGEGNVRWRVDWYVSMFL